MIAILVGGFVAGVIVGMVGLAAAMGASRADVRFGEDLEALATAGRQRQALEQVSTPKRPS